MAAARDHMAERFRCSVLNVRVCVKTLGSVFITLFKRNVDMHAYSTIQVGNQDLKLFRSRAHWWRCAKTVACIASANIHPLTSLWWASLSGSTICLLSDA